MKVIEECIRSKVGHSLETCEDNFIVTSRYACVVDGATTSGTRRWTNKNFTSGQWASHILCQAIQNITPPKEWQQPQKPSAQELISYLNQCIANAYEKEHVLDYMKEHPSERATASLVVYSHESQELIMVGDCQAMVIQKTNSKSNQTQTTSSTVKRYQHEKFVDTVTSQARAMLLSSELLLHSRNGNRNSGNENNDSDGNNTAATTNTTATSNTTSCTPSSNDNNHTKMVMQLQQDDIGRQYIQDLLIRQRLFQNNPLAPSKYRYWVIDGFPIDGNEGIHVHPISLPSSSSTTTTTPTTTTTELVLATDGYPKLFPTLTETEEYLKQCVANDPLLIGMSNSTSDDDHANNTHGILSTKGVGLNAESYDDRTYVRLQL